MGTRPASQKTKTLANHAGSRVNSAQERAKYLSGWKPWVFTYDAMIVLSRDWPAHSIPASKDRSVACRFGDGSRFDVFGDRSPTARKQIGQPRGLPVLFSGGEGGFAALPAATLLGLATLGPRGSTGASRPQRGSNPPSARKTNRAAARAARLVFWRRGGDSNPRDLKRPNGFRDRRIQPLCHLSISGNVAPRIAGRHGKFWRRVGDSNPGDAFGAYTISNRAPSASSDNSPKKRKGYYSHFPSSLSRRN